MCVNYYAYLNKKNTIDVTSSGVYIIYAYLDISKLVDVIDINYFALKIAMIKTYDVKK